MTHPVMLVSRFHTGTWQGHGGVHRTAQVVEILGRAGLTIPVSPACDAAVTGSTGFGIAKSLLNYVARQIPGNAERKARAVSRAQFLSRARAYPGCRAVIWEDTNDRAPSELSGGMGAKLIAMPHNVEALDPHIFGNRSHRERMRLLERELSTLRRADAVFTICLEEQWLLRACGIDAFCLPYHPPAGLETELLTIRARRLGAGVGPVLILGTAKHLPTRRGMEEVLQWLNAMRNPVNVKAIVAGHGTECFRPLFGGPDVVVRGAVSQEDLGELMVSAKAAIVHHHPSSGALTRIPEMLMAGIPVLANEDAARASMTAGVHVYRDAKHLADLLGSELPPPKIPERPERQEATFIERVRSMAGM